MVINRLKLHKFRQFVDATIDFQDDNKILILGAGSTGKTTIAEAIKWGLSEQNCSIFSDEKLININAVKTANLMEVIETFVEIELSDGVHKYKTRKTISARKGTRNKIQVVDVVFEYLSYDGDWKKCERKSVFSVGYENFLYIGDGSYYRKKDSLRNFVDTYDPSLQIIRDANDYCRLLARDLYRYLPSSNSLTDCGNKLNLLNERLKNAKEKKAFYEEEKEKNLMREKMLMPPTTANIDAELAKIINDIRIKLAEINALIKEEEETIATFERAKERLEKQRDIILSDKKIPKIQEMLKYVKALDNWTKEMYDSKKDDAYSKVEEEFGVILRKIGMLNAAGTLEQAFDKTQDTSSCRQWLYHFAFVSACRAAFFEDKENLPLIVDYSMSTFSRSDMHSIIQYLMSRPEQIIWLAHPIIEDVDGVKDGIKTRYVISSNAEYNFSKIEMEN